jgi:hypothetical protein
MTFHGGRQIYLLGRRTTLDIPENFHEFVQLKIWSKDCKLAGTLHGNSSVKIFARLVDLSNCRLELEFDLREGSKLEIACFVERCRDIKLIQRINLSGEYSHATVRNACRTRSGESISMQVIQMHAAPRSKSSAITNASVDGDSAAEITGTVDVSRDSHGSESEQYAKGILLSDGAGMSMSPHLNILASDVACKHGAASGGLDEEAVLYAQSRGISPIRTKEILANGFVFSAFDGFNHPFWEMCLAPLEENS